MAQPTIKAKLVLDTSGGGSSGGGLARASSNGKGGGLAGAAGFGKLAGAVAAGTAALEVIKKFIGKLVDASPRLQQQLSILGKGITLMLRPIGDVLSLFLKPFAIAMLKWGIKFYRKWAESDFLKTAREEGLGQAFKDVSKETTAESVLGGDVPSLGTLQIGNVLESLDFVKTFFTNTLPNKFETFSNTFSTWIEDLQIKATNLGDRIGEALHEKFGGVITSIETFLGETWPNLLNSVFESIDFFFNATLPDAWESVKESFVTFWTTTLPEALTKLWESIKTFWNTTLPEIFTKLWESIKEFWNVKLPEWIKSGFETLKDTITNLIPSWVSDMASQVKAKISNIISSAKSFLGFDGDSQSHDDVLITKTGVVHKFNPNDNIVAFQNPNKGAAAALSGGGGGNSFNINVSVNALDASSINSSVIDNITRQITENLKRELLGRSSYGVGI
jgi:hypothetical protein